LFELCHIFEGFVVCFSVVILFCFLVTRHDNKLQHLFHTDTQKRITDLLFFRGIYRPPAQS